jgi:hypothetical protein
MDRNAPDEPLGDAEAARVQRRDRRRRARMVVDNAGVKRVRQALAHRRPAATPADPGKAGPTS